MYTMSEAAEQLGISKASIYRKLETLKEDLRDCIQIKSNTKYLDSRGIEIIKESLGFNPPKDDNLTEMKGNDLGLIYLNHIQDLKEQIKDLKQHLADKDNQYQQQLLNKDDYYRQQINQLVDQLNQKDLQLNQMDLRMSEQNKLIENSQILLKQQQDKIFLIEDKSQQKNSFWTKIFGNQQN